MKTLNELTIEIIQRCPNNCLHCSSFSHPASKDILELEDILNVTAQGAQLGLKRICLSGGEPLLHPELAQIMSGIYRTGLSISFYTTGISLTPRGEAFPVVDWTFLNKDKTILIFSLHSHKAETHDSFSGRRGAFDQTRQSIMAACAQGFSVETHIVPNKMNIEELKETVKVASSWGVNKVSFLRLVPQGRAQTNKEKLVLNTHEEVSLTAVGQELQKDVQMKSKTRFGIPFSASLAQQKRCNAAETKLIIRHDGKILPCEAFKDIRYDWLILGDIRTTSLGSALEYGSKNLRLNQAKLSTTTCESCPAQMLYGTLLTKEAQVSCEPL